MTLIGWLQAALVFALVWLCVKPLGTYMAVTFEGGRTWMTPVLGPLERTIYRISRVDAGREMSWKAYAFSVVAFSLVSLVYLYLLLRTQAFLPLNPQGFGNLAPDLAWNTAVSFMTNTNWQFYSGESTLSYLSQMAGLAWHMFVSAGTGIAIAIAFVRGVARANVATIGNFWVDLTRAVLYILLPISVVGALIFAWQGMPQNFSAYTPVKTLEGATQSIPQGPMASMELIKELGTNGGGFVGANSAATWENPNGFTNLLELFCILLIGAALTFTYGRYVKNQRQGWALFAAMSIILALGWTAAYAAEAAGNPIVHALGVSGGNMEGKETRFGIAASALFAVITTATSCGAVNAMHDSFTALGGLIPLVNMQLGEVVFGGVGSGLYGMLAFVVLTVFVAGLMVGRTPEFLGKKIERREVQYAILAILVVPAFSLIPASIASILPAGTATLGNAGPHGFSEILYAYTSGVNNNGSAFGGLGPNAYWNVSMGISMLFGRLAEAIPALALAGALAGKKSIPPTAGTFTTTSPIFVVLLIGVILIVGALTFFPADALGPIVEHLLAAQGKDF
ncbi:potassium-transporting ATPase potassium-binding subunit [Vulcanimicrobium alpinum]|uniref:Potassium-transporting ATPase potassium-binding subunit n=1 Tax=Vulcanimicrobium alpinum TaxID=3016050 RepID=A0AAN1XWX4_UNVUL|nr:potassium-transporting ATPase subunit KdpA [Vulcanimicrobium alpinum]BDE06872.1 potassium-transporting ATPase potassium-binding subunit [Vulcanimicrobium alpinum]